MNPDPDRIAVLAPGQGSQGPRMLAPWLDAVAGSTDPGPLGAAALAWAAGAPELVDLDATGTPAQLAATEVAQPLLALTGLCAASLLGELPGAALLLAGHSVGEWTVTALAGVLPAGRVLDLVALRGRAMAADAAQAPTGMAAVLGGEPDVVRRHLESLGLVAANRNGAGQVVAAGDTAALARLAADPPAGARVRPLPVAGAFHTPAMATAERRLAEALAADLDGAPDRVADPARPLVGNADGGVVTAGRAWLTRLHRQVTRPVDFEACLHTLAASGVGTVVELPPAGTLSALVRRVLPGVRTLALRSPDDLPAVRLALSASGARA